LWYCKFQTCIFTLLHQIQYSGALCSIAFFFRIDDLAHTEDCNRMSACMVGYGHIYKHKHTEVRNCDSVFTKKNMQKSRKKHAEVQEKTCRSPRKNMQKSKKKHTEVRAKTYRSPNKNIRKSGNLIPYVRAFKFGLRKR